MERGKEQKIELEKCEIGQERSEVGRLKRKEEKGRGRTGGEGMKGAEKGNE